MKRNFIKKQIQILLLLTTVIVSQHSHAQFADPEEYYKSFSDCDLHFPGENRVFLESQSWWQPDENVPVVTAYGAPDDFGHLRVGTCFPLNQQETGVVQFKLQITFHKYPFNENDEGYARFDYLNPHLYGRLENNEQGRVDVAIEDGFNAGEFPLSNARINNNGTIRIGNNANNTRIAYICGTAGQPPTDTDTCVIGLEFNVDTNIFPSNGLQEMRFFTSILDPAEPANASVPDNLVPDNQENHVSTGWPLRLVDNVLDNGRRKETRDYNGDGQGIDFQIQGRGWYTGLNYVTGSIYDFDPSTPVDGSWRPHIESDKGPTLGAEITRTRICLNPDFNIGDPGLVLLDVPGELRLNDSTPSNDKSDKHVESMTFDELLDNATDINGLKVSRNDTRFFENGQLKPRPDGKPHRLAVRTEAGCDLLDATGNNDCDCAFNANARESTRRSGGLLRDGVNNDGSCLYKDSTFFYSTANVDGLTNANTPTGVNNHAQKTTSMLVVPFNLEINGTTGTPTTPTTHIISVDSVEVNQGNEPEFLVNGNDGNPRDLTVNISSNPPIPVNESVTVRLTTRVGTARARNEDFNWMNPTATISGASQTFTFEGLINNNGATDSGDEQFSIQVSIQDDSSLSGNVEAGDNATVTILKQMINNLCGDPGYDRFSARAALYVWQDCGTNNWHVRAAGGTQPWEVYMGEFSSSQSFNGVTISSLENNDIVDTSIPQQISFRLGVAGISEDAIDFELPSGNTCLTVSDPASQLILLGNNEMPVTPPIDILTLQPCQ